MRMSYFLLFLSLSITLIMSSFILFSDFVVADHNPEKKTGSCTASHCGLGSPVSGGTCYCDAYSITDAHDNCDNIQAACPTVWTSAKGTSTEAPPTTGPESGIPSKCDAFGSPSDTYCDDLEENCASGFKVGSVPECQECTTGKWKDCKSSASPIPISPTTQNEVIGFLPAGSGKILQLGNLILSVDQILPSSHAKVIVNDTDGNTVASLIIGLGVSHSITYKNEVYNVKLLTTTQTAARIAFYKGPSQTTITNLIFMSQQVGVTGYDSVNPTGYTAISNLAGISLLSNDLSLTYNGVSYDQIYILFDKTQNIALLGVYDSTTGRVLLPVIPATIVSPADLLCKA